MATMEGVACGLQRILGVEMDALSRATGAVQRMRKFSGSSLMRMLVLTLLGKGDADVPDFHMTATQLGIFVSLEAIAKRFSPQLVEFLRRALEKTLNVVLHVPPAATALLAKFTAVLIGDSTTIIVPDELANEFPGCGGKSRSGRAALKLQVVWDLLTGTFKQLMSEPGKNSDVKSQAANQTPPAGSMSIFDLGYFSIPRFRNIMQAGAFWISRLQYGTSVLDSTGTPLNLLNVLRGYTGTGPLDIAILLGEKERLACRLVALRVTQEVAGRRRQKAREKAQKDGREVSKAYLELLGWTLFVSNCEADQLAWKEIVVLYRARWQIELLFKVWKSHNHLDKYNPGDSPHKRMALFYAKLIAAIVQHWIQITATWHNGRRSLMKAAPIIAKWTTSLITLIDDPDQLISTLETLATLLNQCARRRKRGKSPSLFELLDEPELLDWTS
jgi:hypothetical protein